MLTSADLLHLPYTPDLTEGGITYAIRSLPYTYDRMGGSPFDRLRRVVAGAAVELAFRRYLGEQNIPFAVKEAAPFTDHGQYDVLLGGHRCDIQSFLLTRRSQITELRRDPVIALKAPALVPSDLHAADGRSDDDLYLFAFISGLIAASRDDLNKVIKAGHAFYLLHAMPDGWRRPRTWRPLGPLTLKSESDAALTLEIGGQNESREYLECRIELPPRTRLVVEETFFSVTSIHVKGLPQARLGIHSPAHTETHLIHPHEWGNIWVYGMDILLTGYVQRAEFAQRASFVQPGARVFQYDQTRRKNLAMPVADLKPLSGLFEKVREWEANKAR
ncbi:MAG: hypothetical protein A2Z03_10555 [Chloroflexi bacterium RBG_16_56_8]|nr:MAG: hypothetical protein A2Z03_10555 [Chloroflexi bacterium RBG_16_56_8]